MPHKLAAIATLAIFTLPQAAGGEEQGFSPPPELGFLVAGKDYVIRFPEGQNIFKTTRSEVMQATVTSAGQTEVDGEQRTETRPATWTINYSVQVFHVVRFGGGSWVLLRHPAKMEDSFKWFGHRRALAILQSGRAKKIEDEPDGEKTLARLRKAAEREIETDETWVNLAHAVAIADVPTEDVEFRFSVNSKIKSR